MNNHSQILQHEPYSYFIYYICSFKEENKQQNYNTYIIMFISCIPKTSVGLDFFFIKSFSVLIVEELYQTLAIINANLM